MLGSMAYMGSLGLSQRLSPLLPAYRKLPEREQLEWDARLPSTVHALVITAATIYLSIFSSVFGEAGDRPFIPRTSPLSEAALGFSLGYFFTDLLLMLYHFPVLGGVEMGLHHLVALTSIAAAVFQGEGHAYTLALLATECTTPLVNLRYLLEKGGWREHAVYRVNGVALLVSWLVARILLFFKFFHHVAAHQRELSLVAPLSRWLLYLVPPTLFILNMVWFFKICKGALKMFGWLPDRTARRGVLRRTSTGHSVASAVCVTKAAWHVGLHTRGAKEE